MSPLPVLVRWWRRIASLMPDVETLRAFEPEDGDEDRGGAIVWTDDGWVAVETDEVTDGGDPVEVDPGECEDSYVRLAAYAPSHPEEWASGYCWLRIESSEGEWGDVVLEYTTYNDDDEGYPDPDSEVAVDRIESVSRAVVHDKSDAVIGEMVSALSTSVSTSTYQRAILCASVVRAAARAGMGDVWERYVEDADEASLAGFAGWLERPEFRALLDDVGEEMWPVRGEAWEVSDRVLLRTLTVIQHFGSLEWDIEASGGIEQDDADGVVDESVVEEDEDSGVDVEVKFEPE